MYLYARTRPLGKASGPLCYMYKATTLEIAFELELHALLSLLVDIVEANCYIVTSGE